MGLGTMIVAFIYAKKHKYPTTGFVPLKEALKITFEAIPSLLLMVIMDRRSRSGIFRRDRGGWGMCAVLPDPVHCV